MHVPNLSRAASLICAHSRALQAFYADPIAPAVVRSATGYAHEHRTLRRRVHALTGLRFRVAVRAIASATTSRWAYFNLGEAASVPSWY